MFTSKYNTAVSTEALNDYRRGGQQQANGIAVLMLGTSALIGLAALVAIIF